MIKTQAPMPITQALLAFWQWLMDKPQATRHASAPMRAKWHPMQGSVATRQTTRPATAATPDLASARVATQVQRVKAVRHQPLRVVRLLEANQAPSLAGRLRISGRMADVCAELDRLAAHEASMR